MKALRTYALRRLLAFRCIFCHQFSFIANGILYTITQKAYFSCKLKFNLSLQGPGPRRHRHSVIFTLHQSSHAKSAKL